MELFGFGKKKRMFVVPAAPRDMPTFPEPEELDSHLPEFPRMPEMESPSSQSLPTVQRETQRFDAREMKRPVFLKADLFESVLNDIQAVRARLEKSEKMGARIEEVHDSQGRLLQSWNATMKEIHDKLLFVDSILFKKGDADE